MSLFAKLFNKNTGEVSSKNVEDFVSLTRVYFQSVIAANLGITNIRFVPDVANFKRLFKIPTQGGRLGQAEKAASRKMLMQDYGISENFFKEIDTSVKKHCRTQNDVQGYLFMYQGFSNDLMMLMGNLVRRSAYGSASVLQAFHLQGSTAQHDRKNRTRRLYKNRMEKGRCTQDGSGSTPVQRASGIFGTMDDRVRLQRSDAGQKGTETESQRREIKEKEF